MATSRPQRSTERRSGGYTLLEILVVIMLISGLAGMGLSLLQTHGTDLERALTGIRDLARAARTHARFYRAPARVVMSPPPGPITGDQTVIREVSVIALQPVAEWNFDDGRPGGSRGIGGELGGAVIDEGGRFGKGLFPDPDVQASGVTVDARLSPVFDLRRGFLVRADVKLDRIEPTSVVRLGEAFELGVDGAGRLRGTVTMEREGGRPGRQVVLRGVRRVPLGRWFKAELAVDGLRATLRLDFLDEAAAPVTEECWRDPQAQFVISDAGAPVSGVVDTIELFAFDRIATVPLPEFVEVASGPAALHFDPEGGLDRRYHPELPRYVLRFDSAEEVIAFELGGLVR